MSPKLHTKSMSSTNGETSNHQIYLSKQHIETTHAIAAKHQLRHFKQIQTSVEMHVFETTYVIAARHKHKTLQFMVDIS